MRYQTFNKILAFLSALIVGLLACIAIIGGIWQCLTAQDTIAYKTSYAVKHGDTIWRIAGKYAREGQDLRQVVYYIEHDNNLPINGYIEPGQKLVINVRE